MKLDSKFTGGEIPVQLDTLSQHDCIQTEQGSEANQYSILDGSERIGDRPSSSRSDV